MRLMKAVSLFLLVLAGAWFIAMIYFVATGFPVEWPMLGLRFKNMRKPFIVLMGLLVSAAVAHPGRRRIAESWQEPLEKVARHPLAIWALFLIYSVLFTWQQLTEYWALEINFMPFSFYDYMLYYFSQGKINFTGLLHGYYHINNILYFLAPVWHFFRSSFLLVLVYGLLASLAVWPLFALAKEKFKQAALPLIICFIYLNYRYLQNVLLMNFSVEILYPFFLFLFLWAAYKEKWSVYYLSLFLGLLVKEDSFIYFGAVGFLVCFIGGKKRIVHGVLGMLLSVLYLVFILKVFIPATGNNILEGDLQNFGEEPQPIGQMLLGYLTRPLDVLKILFGDKEKIETYFKLLSRLLFLPLLSPAVFLVLASVFPLFAHSTGRDSDFTQLNFHYAAAVVPFVFIAFTMGFSNLYRRMTGPWRSQLTLLVCVLLLFLNGGSYVTRKIKTENLDLIQWSREVPPKANLVTHGQLLPYLGYREYNYYFAEPFELDYHPAHESFVNADFYLIDLNAPLYPMDRNYIENKITLLKRDPRYDLIRQDGERYLFKKRGA